MEIVEIEAVILTFEVPGSKWNFLLPGTSLFLPAGDVGGEIKCIIFFYQYTTFNFVLLLFYLLTRRDIPSQVSSCCHNHLRTVVYFSKVVPNN